MASADGITAAEDKRARRAADLIGIDAATWDAIHALVTSETKLLKRKRAIFSGLEPPVDADAISALTLGLALTPRRGAPATYPPNTLLVSRIRAQAADAEPDAATPRSMPHGLTLGLTLLCGNEPPTARTAASAGGDGLVWEETLPLPLPADFGGGYLQVHVYEGEAAGADAVARSNTLLSAEGGDARIVLKGATQDGAAHPDIELSFSYACTPPERS